MNTNPINLAARFLLEIAMLITLGYWGWHLNGAWRYAGVAGLPIVAAALWGIFRIPNSLHFHKLSLPGVRYETINPAGIAF